MLEDAELLGVAGEEDDAEEEPGEEGAACLAAPPAVTHQAHGGDGRHRHRRRRRRVSYLRRLWYESRAFTTRFSWEDERATEWKVHQLGATPQRGIA